jgi:hypothetical protein
MQAHNKWIAGMGLLVATAANAQDLYQINPGSLYEHRDCVSPFTQAWPLKGTFRLTEVGDLSAKNDSITDYEVSDILWSTGEDAITGRGTLRVRRLSESEQLMELDLDIAGKKVHVAGGAHSNEKPLRILIPLTSQEDPYCYSTFIFLDASLVPRTCSTDFDNDGEVATDKDITAFFACLAGSCCDQCADVDFDGDGDAATDADIESFFRVLAGGPC